MQNKYCPFFYMTSAYCSSRTNLLNLLMLYLALQMVFIQCKTNIAYIGPTELMWLMCACVSLVTTFPCFHILNVCNTSTFFFHRRYRQIKHIILPSKFPVLRTPSLIRIHGLLSVFNWPASIKVRVKLAKGSHLEGGDHRAF